MRRMLANALFVAGVLAVFCPFALARGAHGFSGGARGFSGGATGFSRGFSSMPRTHLMPQAVRPAPRPSSSRAYSVPFNFPSATGSSLINPLESSCILNSAFAGSYYCRQYFSGRAAWGYEPIYPYWMPSMGYDTDQSTTQAAAPQQDDELSAQVGNLAAEVEMMREDQAARDMQAGQPSAVTESPSPTTVLVYRDGHQMEVHDYAIQGQTLWVFSNQAAQRVSLAALDLPATERVNAQRGVEFSAPDGQ